MSLVIDDFFAAQQQARRHGLSPEYDSTLNKLTVTGPGGPAAEIREDSIVIYEGACPRPFERKLSQIGTNRAVKPVYQPQKAEVA